MAQVESTGSRLPAVTSGVDDPSAAPESPSIDIVDAGEEAREVPYSGSSPDSGHSTSHDDPAPVGGEHRQLSEMEVISPPGQPQEGYWPPHTIIEPIAINPETGFTTVMLDPLTISSYPHGTPGWPPGHAPYSMGGPHLQPPPPGHYCSYEIPPPGDSYPYVTHYETLHPHYEASPYEIHPPPTGGHPHFGPKKNARGGSLSPKRPGNASGRSASQGNGTPVSTNVPRSGGGGGGGRYTPSPSSAGSRGSSPGQSQQPVTGPSTNPMMAHPAATGNPLATANQHVVHLHVNPGETISLRMGEQVQVIQGPATVRMVSMMGAPPIPLPVQVPPGHVLQQIVDENGTLQHVILSAAHQPPPPPTSGPPPAAPMGVLPPHPPPPPPHFGTTHNVGQPPPHFYANPASGYGPQPGYPNQFGPAPMAANLRPHPHGHPRHHNQGPSSPPPAINLPNERAQRQALKLRNKYEQKLKRNNNIAATPAAQQVAPASPKKDNNNVRKLKDRNQDDVCKETADEKETTNDGQLEQFAARLADWPSPQVSGVTSRTALISWKSVENLTGESLESETRVGYALGVDEKSRENKNKFSYNGKETSCRVTALHPGTEYVVRLSALVNDVRVKEVVAEFRTEACAPDAPLPPKIINRLRTSLQVKWTAPSDNGSHIVQYVLECDDGTGKGNFSQVYTGKGRQFTVKDLRASTCYALRVSAANQVGQSGWSEPLLVSTLGSAPPAPAPPTLLEVGVTQLGLGWTKSPADQLYTLQISDPRSGYGFRNAHHGPESEYVCTGLARSTPYKFRLQAQNEDGASRWSDEVSYTTLADRPSPPCRVQVKGKVHATQFRLRWDRPADDGGSAVTLYFVELDDGDGYRSIWSGPDLECTCDKLSPGRAYRARVACLSSGGRSDFSDSCLVSTEPVQPGAGPPPAVVGKPRSHCLNLRWGAPEFDGGAMITQYEVNMINPDGSSRIAYVGRDLECLVPSLLPGRNYAFQVRATNRVGAGPWSAKLEVTSGAGVPGAGGAPQVTSRSPHSLQLAWEEPANSGAPIIGYRLEMSSKPLPSRSASVSSSTTGSTDGGGGSTSSCVLEETVDLEQMTFNLVYAGPARSCEVKNLQPASLCYFRVQASNSVGVGPFSPISSATTLASSPAAVSALRCLESTTSSLTVSWSAPHCNGSPVFFYNVDTGDRLVPTQGPVTSMTLENLKPGTVYRLRVQAVNAMGTGPFSSSLKAATRSPPPPPPRLECVSSSHDVLHLRWGDGKNTDFLQYCLEREDDSSEGYVTLYSGPNHSYKVTRLAERSCYRFRINAANEAGVGDWSPEVTFSTTRALPVPPKAPTISYLSETNCRVTWSACKLPTAAADQIDYEVQIRTKDSSPVMTKRVSGTEVAVSVLRPRSEYSARVRAIRLCDGAELVGTYSPSTVFATPHSAHEVRRPSHTKSHASQGSEKVRKELSDWQLKLIFLAGFFLLAFVIIVALIYFGLPKQKL